MNRKIVLAVAAVCAVAAGAVAAGRLEIVSEHRSADSWKPAVDSPRVAVGYPAAVADKGADVCVSLGFMIQADGTTSDLTGLNAWSSTAADGRLAPQAAEPFVRSAAAAVSMWKFEAVKARPRPIYTAATFAFEGSGKLAPEAIREHCRIDNLVTFISRAQDKLRETGRGYQEYRTAGSERYARHPNQVATDPP